MEELIRTHPHATAARDGALQSLRSLRDAGLRPVLLVPSFDDVLERRRDLASTDLALGCTIASPASWVEDAWGLFGDGRRIASEAERLLSMQAALACEPSLSQGPGTVEALCEIARQAIDLIDSAKPPFASPDAAIAATLSRYRGILDEHGSCEGVEAIALLDRSAGSLEGFGIVALGFAKHDIDRPLSLLLGKTRHIVEIDGCALAAPGAYASELRALLSHLFSPADPVEPQGSLRFILPAGKASEARMIAEAAIAAGAEAGKGGVVATCRNPKSLFDLASPFLRAAGIGCNVRGSRRFGDTEAGLAMQRLLDLAAEDAPLDVLEASDFAASVFCPCSRARAFELDARWRGDRLTDRDNIFDDLIDERSTPDRAFIAAIEAARRGDFATVASSLTASLATRGDKRSLREQSAALESARAFFEKAAEAEVDPAAAFALLSRRSIPFSKTVGDGRVRIMSLEDAARLPAASCETLIACDLTSVSYPIKTADTPTRLFLERIGLTVSDDPLARARMAFKNALSAARTTIFCERPLSDADGGPLYPSTTFEELVDCYRADTTDEGSMDEALSIPLALKHLAVTAGEGNLLLDATGSGQQPIARTMPFPDQAHLSTESKGLIVIPRHYGNGFFEGLDVSPSQVESYLECPYQWFAKRRLNLDEPDEGFGGIERGSFMHSVLQLFYERLESEGIRKVEARTMTHARETLARVFEETAEHQFSLKPSSNRYVPENAWEKALMDALLTRLTDYLPTEAALLPSFAPRHLEWHFGQDEPFRYAGCNMTGQVDRIDVDASGRAVVIDYKSSLSKDYRLKQDPDDRVFALPRKMQALIYAKAVRDILGLDVAAAIYVNPLGRQILGAFDRRALGPEDIPFASTVDAQTGAIDFEGIGTFDELIEATERTVAARMENLKAGIIAPDKLSDKVCAYCPVTICSGRAAS